VLATAVEQDAAVVWVVMNNLAYGTIAGLEKAHFGTTFGTVFRRNGEPYSPNFAQVAKAYGVDAVRIESAAQFKPALEHAVACGKPYLLDVIMENAPVPTTGHWNIMDIYSPGEKRTHVTT
jgi:acetolactate synthase-1/2/3 large subunit